MKILALLMLGLSLPASAAGSYTVGEVLDHLQAHEEAAKHVRFDFVQDVSFAANGLASQVKGNALFGKNGRFRIAKTLPEKQVTVSDGQKVWVYTPSFNQVVVGKVRDWVRNSVLPQGMVPLQNLTRDLRKNFSVSLDGATPTAGEVRLKAVPKDAALGYSLELVVSTSSWFPVRTVYVSDSATVSTTFVNLEVDPQIMASAFRFSAPPGADVIPLN